MTWLVLLCGLLIVTALIGLAALLSPRTGRETQHDDPVPPGYEAPAGLSGDAVGLCLRPGPCRLCGGSGGHWSGCLLVRGRGADLIRALGGEG